MNPRVVVTTIYPPGKAVKKISEQKRLIAVGDKKTPDNWHYPNVRYINIHEQLTLSYRVVKELPYNHYGRKMVGYLEAIKEGADTIIDTDDDNIPNDNWEFPSFSGSYDTTGEDMGFVNIYSLFSSKSIWPRGLPLDKIKSTPGAVTPKETNVGIWQGLADGDPDVDAIYRLTSNEPCVFDKRKPIVLDKGTLSPFNSQNTAFRKEMFPLLYLPAYVTFRFTDILRGWVAQPIMWAAGYRLGITEATVVQERNPHDYMKDFESEIPCYLNGNQVIELVSKAVNSKHSVTDNLREAYRSLCEHKVVKSEELRLLDLWLNDVKNLSSNRER